MEGELLRFSLEAGKIDDAIITDNSNIVTLTVDGKAQDIGKDKEIRINYEQDVTDKAGNKLDHDKVIEVTVEELIVE
ncbi:hypothetical protein F8154_08485 [Alkaliphilus pronyensis]|uniref:Uncharacterized protein n=1 Tax=Alkaliphilus pronyensis TaxID=1482732 RepID=A0A6I0FB80_9FIRM|nr:hypothetical protein [Alkaliphilus pronyensis]KAB3534750.1 hypothetical protein F8154_08485 [Alkaliphilus pronyensis]